MRTFPVTHSIPSAEHLAEVVKADYDLGPRLECRLFRSGIADTYDVRAGSRRFMLRICRVAWTTRAGISYEVDALLHLCARRAPVAGPVARRDGGYITYIAAPEGRRLAVLFAYASGREHVRDIATSKSYGDALARIHNAGEGFTSRRARAPIDANFLVRRPLARLTPLAVEHPKAWGYLAKLGRKLDGRLEETGRGLSTGLCHGDSHGGNAS
ncbi:MAG TPA: phosphotransferase, partial [Alphaproteobacteria bacterium]|nr:phosphotransferase [Alphaproteobacteria bacterium]